MGKERVHTTAKAAPLIDEKLECQHSQQAVKAAHDRDNIAFPSKYFQCYTLYKYFSACIYIPVKNTLKTKLSIGQRNLFQFIILGRVRHSGSQVGT